MKSLALVVVLVSVACVADGQLGRSYLGYSVYRVRPQTGEQLRHLEALAANVTGVESDHSLLDFWQYPAGLDRDVDVMVAPDARDGFIRYLRAANLAPALMIPDVEIQIQEQSFRQLKPHENRIGSQNFNVTEFFTGYHELNEYHQFLDYLASLDPATMRTEMLGKSFEGNPIMILKIGNSRNKPIVWMDAGTHAREWLGPTTLLYMAYQIADANTKCQKGEEGCPQELRPLLEQFDWQFLSNLNPDGYVYTWNNDRLWRKTRSQSKAGGVLAYFCRGTDPNRNYGYHWGGEGTSSNPCSDIFRGDTAFSEVETKTVTDYLLTQAFQNGTSRIKFFLSLHTYSQMMLLPWGYSATVDLPEAYPDMEYVGKKGAEAIYKRYQTDYTVGNSARILYAASGGADDWAHGVAKIKYAYTFELRDKGNNGFVMPPKFILPTGEETFDGVMTMLGLVARELNGEILPSNSRRINRIKGNVINGL